MALGFAECLSMKAECATFWAGWGVIATAAVGLLTLLVAALAWRTSRQAATIAANQHKDAQSLKDETARIVGRLLLHEVSALPARIRNAEKRLARVGLESGVRAWVEAVHNAVADLDNPLLQSAELVEDRIHTLPVGLGADLATLISHARDISGHVVRLHRNLDKAADFSAPKQNGTYVTQVMNQTNDLKSRLEFVGDLATQFSGEFRQFVLGPGIDIPVES